MMKSESSFRRAVAIAKASFHTLRKNPGLLWFPAIAGALNLCFGIVCIAIAALRDSLGAAPAHDLAGLVDNLAATPHSSSVAGFFALLGFQIITLVTAVALTHATLEALAGRPWTVRQGFARVRARRSALAGYALLRTVGGMLLRGDGKKKKGKRRRRGGPLTKLARLAWWAATYLTIPVLTREDVGPFDSIGRSAKLFRATWKEGILGRWTFGWLWIPYGLVCVLPLAVCAGLAVQNEAVWAMVALGSATGFGLGHILFGTLDTIYRTALYVFATEGVVPEPFDVEQLHTVWRAGPATDVLDVDGHEVDGSSRPDDDR